GGAERRPRARAGGLAARAHRTARRGAARAGRAAGGGVRRALPAPALRRAAPARRRGARAGRGPAVTIVGRAVRRARSDHPRRAAARVPGPAGAAAQDRDLRDARHARGGAGGRPDRGGGGRAAPGGRDAGGAAREPRPRGAGAGGRVMLHEVLVETGRHVMLVGVSVGLATAIGVPLGVWLTRRPGWSRIVLGLASVLQTIPSLALFGFLIPVPWIGGVGVRAALVALTLYGLLPVLRNTVTGIAGVDPAIRAAGRGMGVTVARLVWRVGRPLAGGGARGLRAPRGRHRRGLEELHRAAHPGRAAGADGRVGGAPGGAKARPGRHVRLRRRHPRRADRHVRGVHGDGAGGDPEGEARGEGSRAGAGARARGLRDGRADREPEAQGAGG